MSRKSREQKAKGLGANTIPFEREAFSVVEAAAKLDVCKATLYNEWARGGGPKYFMLGKRRLITPDALAAYIREQEEKTAAAAEKP